MEKNRFTRKNILGFFKISFQISVLYSVLKFILSFLGVMLPIASAYFWKIILDDIAFPAQNKLLGLLVSVGAYGLLLVVGGVLRFCHEYIDRIYSDELTLYVEKKEIEACSAYDIRYFDDTERQNRNNELSKAYKSSANISWELFDLICNTVSFLISFILVGRYHLILAITTAVLVLPKYFFDVFADKKQRAFNINISGDQRRMKYYGDALQNSDILLEAKLNNAEDYFTNQYLCLSRKLNARIGLHKAKYGLLALLMDLIANLSFFAVILLTVLDALSGKISIGTIQYSWSLADNLKNRFAAMLHNISKLKSDRDSMVLLSEFVEENTAIETSAGDVCPQDDLVIEFEHVAFAYPGTDKNVLNDVNFTIHSGEKIGLVGLNGSGKTTIVKLLMRFYDPTAGSIKINGKDIRTYDIKSVRAVFSSLFQENIPYIFIPLRDGIALSRYDERNNTPMLDQACERSGFSAVLQTKGADYDKILNDPMCIQLENSFNLSGGEWQKLALARTYFRNSAFYIFDEPSASLDVFAEEKIFEDFSRLSERKTAVLISHRLSNMRFCSKILVLDEGKIAEQGSHEALLAKHGIYARLFELQASRYQEA